MRKIWLVLAAAAPLLLAGCAGGQTSAPTAATIAARMQAAGNKLTSYTADVTGTTMFGGKSRTVTGQEWVQKPDLFRAEITVNGDTVLTVLDGKTIYTYNQANNQVWEVPVPSPEGGPSSRTPAPSSGKGQTGGRTAPGRGSGFMEAPLLTGMVQRALQDYNMTLAGRDTVAGQSTYVLDLKPKSGISGLVASQMKLWVDARVWLPVKVTSVIGGNQFSWEFDNLQVNPAIPPAEFQFQVPPGAKVETITPKGLQVTLSEAQEPVPGGNVPTGVITAGIPTASGQVVLTTRS